MPKLVSTNLSSKVSVPWLLIPPFMVIRSSVSLIDVGPVSPKTVMLESVSTSQFVFRDTVNVFTTAASGVLCSIDLISNRGKII